MRLVAQMVGQLDLQRPLDQPLGQPRQKPSRPGDLLLGPRSRQQLINDLIGKLAAQIIRHAVQDPRRGRRLA